jgi:hypothetical protein
VHRNPYDRAVGGESDPQHDENKRQRPGQGEREPTAANGMISRANSPSSGHISRPAPALPLLNARYDGLRRLLHHFRKPLK